MNILDVIRGGKKEDPEVIAKSIVEIEARLPELQKQMDEAGRALLEKEQAGLLGGSVSANEIDALEKKRDRAVRQVEAINDAVAKLREALVQALTEKRVALEEEQRKLDAFISLGHQKLEEAAIPFYVDIAVCFMVKNGGSFYMDDFSRCPLFNLDRLTLIERLAKEKYLGLSKGYLAEHARMVKRKDEVNEALRDLSYDGGEDPCDEKYIKRAKAVVSN